MILLNFVYYKLANCSDKDLESSSVGKSENVKNCNH